MKFKELRKKNGITLNDISKKLNIGASTYNSYELGTHQPTLDIILKIADLFNVSTDYLLDHKTNNILDLSECPQEVKELIKIITQLDNFEAERVKAFIKGMKTGQEQAKKENYNNWI